MATKKQYMIRLKKMMEATRGKVLKNYCPAESDVTKRYKEQGQYRNTNFCLICREVMKTDTRLLNCPCSEHGQAKARRMANREIKKYYSV